MIQEIIFFMFQIISIYLSVKNMEKFGALSIPDISGVLKLAWIAIIAGPFMEESVFRHTLKYYLTNWSYANYISSVLFGLYHIQNYPIHGSIFFTIYQVIVTTYIGYYLYQLDNFLHGYALHMFYNFSILFCTYLIVYWKSLNKKDEVKEVPTFLWDGIFTSVKYPNKTSDDTFRCTDFKFIDKSKMKEDMQDRDKKLRDVIKKRSSRELLKKGMDDVKMISYATT